MVWDVTSDVVLELDDEGILNDLAVIHHLLALRIMNQDDKPPTESSEENSPSDWIKECTCLASSCEMEGHVRRIGLRLNTLSEQHCQLAKLYVRLSISDNTEMDLNADCHGVTEVKLMTTWDFTAWSARLSHWNAWSVPMSWLRP